MVGIVEQYVLDKKDFFLISNFLLRYAEHLDRAIKQHAEANPKIDFSHPRNKAAMVRDYAKKVRTLS